MEKPDTTMEVNHVETTMNNLHPDTAAPVDETPQQNAASRPARRAGGPGDDVVRWAEFRLALWIGGFALAVIISGQGLLFSAILGLKGDIGVLRADMQRQRERFQPPTLWLATGTGRGTLTPLPRVQPLPDPLNMAISPGKSTKNTIKHIIMYFILK